MRIFIWIDYLIDWGWGWGWYAFQLIVHLQVDKKLDSKCSSLLTCFIEICYFFYFRKIIVTFFSNLMCFPSLMGLFFGTNEAIRGVLNLSFCGWMFYFFRLYLNTMYSYNFSSYGKNFLKIHQIEIFVFILIPLLKLYFHQEIRNILLLVKTLLRLTQNCVSYLLYMIC